MNKASSQHQYPIKLNIYNKNPQKNSSITFVSNKIQSFNISINKSGSLKNFNWKKDSILFLNEVPKKMCRICLEEESKTKIIISPCMCTGTSKYIHEECLKKWIIESSNQMYPKTNTNVSFADFNSDSEKAKIRCEICHFNYIMKFYMSRHFSIEKLKEILRPLLLDILIILFVVVCCIGIIVVLLVNYYDDLSAETKRSLYFNFGLSGGVLVIFCSCILYWKKYRKNIYIQVLDRWVIFNYNETKRKEMINKYLNRLNEDKSDQNILDYNGNNESKNIFDHNINQKPISIKKSSMNISASVIHKSEFRKKYPYIRSISQIA